jgi:hypothetical protein
VKTSLRGAVRYNHGTQAAPSAILWCDADRQWSSVVDALRDDELGVFTLGSYSPAERRGPAIWLKCAVAGVVDGAPKSPVTVLYLPGVSRTDLRAIETCPRELQPLAELQYRGVFWSQANAKDWTVSAFLGSKNGGLGLDVAQDKSTRDALQRALQMGVLLDLPLGELQSRRLDAAWFDALLSPNPLRDVLVWLNDPPYAQAQWHGGRWEVFAHRCRQDFGFDPIADGALAAAERLAGRAGAWAGVWELYCDAYSSFPEVAKQLQAVQPSGGLFADLSGYPSVNESSEAELRYQLSAIGQMTIADARLAIANAEQRHAARRTWLWANMGQASLARTLVHLSQLSELAALPRGGSTVEQMAAAYREGLWRVDAAAMQALATVQSKQDTEAVSNVLRALYVPWLEDLALRFQHAAQTAGGLNTSIPSTTVVDDGLCTIFVDGLRFDVAQQLVLALEPLGVTRLSATWTSVPSVTASGKVWASPVAHLVAGKTTDHEFQPSVASDGRPLNTQNLRKLLADQGIQVLDKQGTGEPTGRAWVECGDLDHYGHQYGLRLARDLDNQLAQIVERVKELNETGWVRFRIVTDHGWLLVPGGLPKSELSQHQTATRWGRCAVLKDSSHGTPLTFGWDWCKDIQIAMAPGISSFISGSEYAHGGLTLQECLVPVIDLECVAKKSSVNVSISNVKWTGLRCHVELSPIREHLRIDIRNKAALADSSVLAAVKVVVQGKASLAVADDELAGTAAVIVVLDENDDVVQRASTVIGE